MIFIRLLTEEKKTSLPCCNAECAARIRAIPIEIKAIPIGIALISIGIGSILAESEQSQSKLRRFQLGLP
jgi:hypothetical protein